jgi:hypothetical protein
MNRFATIISFLLFHVLHGQAQSADTISQDTEWYFSLTNDFYFGPDGGYFDPSFTADHRHLHLEARYNMEDYQTGSLWYGYNFSGGNKLGYYITPMVGIIFGNTDGIAPDVILDIYYGKLDFYSDNEYLIDFSGKENSYFYTWTELTFAPWDWMHFGLALQHTKLHQTAAEIERGVTLGLTYKFISLTGYVFNPGLDGRYGFVSLSVSF